MIARFNTLKELLPNWLDYPLGMENEGEHYCEIFYAAWGKQGNFKKKGAHLIVKKNEEMSVLFIPWQSASQKYCDLLHEIYLPQNALITVKNDHSERARIVTKIKIVP